MNGPALIVMKLLYVSSPPGDFAVAKMNILEGVALLGDLARRIEMSLMGEFD